MTDRPVKTCVACGRSFAWRKKWARDWAQVRYCSDRCRATRGAAEDGAAIEAVIRDVLARRAAGATLCPSEAARVLSPEAWRDRMEDVRSAARRMAAAGEIEITQGGRAVDPDRARGPIRLRRRG